MAKQGERHEGSQQRLHLRGAGAAEAGCHLRGGNGGAGLRDHGPKGCSYRLSQRQKPRVPQLRARGFFVEYILTSKTCLLFLGMLVLQARALFPWPYSAQAKDKLKPI